MNDTIFVFKAFLFSRGLSKATVKNYVSDVSRFVRWYEAKYEKLFTPESINSYLIENYWESSRGNDIHSESNLTERSIERHIASLNKFFTFLTTEHIIQINPLLNTNSANIKQPLKPKDKDCSIDEILKGFKDHLYVQNRSKKTIKNYLLDIAHFLTWIEAVTDHIEPLKDKSVLYKSITTPLIASYKDRLLTERHFSPVSVNRKLSSIRRFISWLHIKGMLSQEHVLSLQVVANIQSENNVLDAFSHLQDEVVIPQNDISQKHTKKSNRFPPLRLFNTLIAALNLFVDSLFILPLVSIFQKTQAIGLLVSGIEVFKSIKPNLKMGQAGSNLDTLIVNGLARGQKEIVYKNSIISPKNISKHMYAPLEIATDSLPIHKRILHNLRHKRPLWYKKYHENSIVHYLHFALLMIWVGMLVFWMQYNFFRQPGSTSPVFASLPLSPPRLLSFKGHLADNFNNPITESSNLRFSLYNDSVSSGSALLWQEVLSVSPDENGNFIALLGRSSHIPERAYQENPELYLGVTQEDNSEMAPRQRLATTGLAQDSEAVGGLRPITESEKSANTLLALDSSGNLSINGSTGSTFQATEGVFSLSGNTLLLTTSTGTDSSVIIAPEGKGYIDLQKSLQNTTENNQYVEALGSVEVDDTFAILATSSAVAALNIRQDATGMLISASSSGTAKFTLDYLGNTMIGNRLAVNGDSLTSINSTFRLLPENVINLYIGESATDITLGALNGSTTVRNNLFVNGTTTLGQSPDDTITLNGRISSHIIASESGKFDIGKIDSSFNNAYLTNLFLTPSATTSGFLRRDSGIVSLLNSSDSFLLGGNTSSNALIKLAGSVGQDSFLNAGNVGIGVTSTLTDKLQVLGDIRIGTTGTDGCLKRYDGTALAGTCSSDERFKKDIKPIENILNKVSKLRPVTFSMRSTDFPEYGFGDGTSYGLIAQEVEQIFPELVETDKFGYKMVKYGPELSMLSLAAIKELSGEINFLKEIITDTTINPNGDIYTIDEENNDYVIKNKSGDAISKVLALSKIFAGSINTGIINASEGIFDGLAITTDNLSISGISLRDYILETIEKSNINTPQIKSGSIKSNFISPLSSDSLIGISLDNSEFAIRNSNSASSAAVATFDRFGNATLSGTLKAQGIHAIDASISGTLRAGKIIADEIDGLDQKLASYSASASNSASITNIYNIYNNASNSAQNSEQLTPTPAISPTILAENSPESSSSADEFNSEFSTLNSELFTDFIPLASHSAALSYVPHLSTDFSTITQGLMVLGYTSVVDLSASDRVTIGGSFILAENSINVLGADLDLQPLKQGNIRFMAGLMTLDTEGNLEVFGNARFAKDVEVRGKLSANLIAPVPGSDLIIQLPGSDQNNSQSIINNANLASQHDLNNTKLIVKNASGSDILTVNNLGDIIASGTARFKDAALGSLNIVRGAQADTSAIDTVASGSAGVGTITRGYTTRTIYSPYVSENSLIYITPRSTSIQSGTQTSTSVPYLARQVTEDPTYNIKGSFTVQIPVASNEEVQYNWWIVN